MSVMTVFSIDTTYQNYNKLFNIRLIWKQNYTINSQIISTMIYIDKYVCKRVLKYKLFVLQVTPIKKLKMRQDDNERALTI